LPVALRVLPLRMSPSRLTTLAPVVGVFVTGALLQGLLWTRAWNAYGQTSQLAISLAGDQVYLLNVGQEFAATRQCQPISKTMSGGGAIPGCFLQMVVGLPLILWPDARAPSLVVEVSHLVAGIIMTVLLTRALSARAATFYLLIFWLSPQRLFHSGFIWDPALMLLPAAVHLWICWMLRGHRSAPASLALGMLLLLIPQMHASSMILLVLTALLIGKKLIAVNWRWAVSGGLIGAVTLLPTIKGYVDGTAASSLPTEGFIGRGLLFVHPFVRGVLFWFRLGSLDFGRMGTKDSVFCLDPAISGSPGNDILCASLHVLSALSVASVVLVIIASWWYFWGGSSDPRRSGNDGAWVRWYVLNCFYAVCICAALSPVTIQTWHVLVAMPAACIPVAAWLDNLWPPSSRWVRWVVILFLALRVPDALFLAYGHPIYRVLPASMVESVRD
jgi:hypothetical protein